MDFKPNAILDGMKREYALRCIFTRDYVNERGFRAVAFLSKNDTTQAGAFYGCPSAMGLDEKCDGPCARCWERHINAYYDAKDAASKPKWVEPQIDMDAYVSLGTAEQFYRTSEIGEEIKRTNADRKIRAFISANGGSGRHAIRYVLRDNDFIIVDMCDTALAGMISCATAELAEAVIERYPDELRLLMGGDK